jgi:perosamine synthetase
VSSPLALLGGTPAVTAPGPHFTWPPLTQDGIKAVLDQLTTSISIYDRSGVIAELEDALAQYFGVRHALLASSGTAALYSMYAAVGIKPGMEVIVPSYTFFATVTPLLHLGATPRLAECDDQGNLDPEDIAARFTERTSAIVVTHMWGTPADITALRAVADSHGVPLLEDCSHAHGASVNGGKVGSFGLASAFSMNGPKPLSAGEGGFLLTDDEEVYYRALAHGHYNKRCRDEIPRGHVLHRYAVTGMGLKHRIHPLAASIALDQLHHLDDRLTGRERIASLMCERLGGLPGIETPRSSPDTRPSWYGLILRYRGEQLGGLPLGRFVDALRAEGCAEVDRPGSTCPLNLLPLFQEPGRLFPELEGRFAYHEGEFPRAESFHRNVLKLPVWNRREDEELADGYVRGFQKVTDNYRDLLG